MPDAISLPTADHAEAEISLLELFGRLVDNLPFIASLGALFAVLSLVYVLLAPPVYEASAMIKVDAPKPGLAAFSEDGIALRSDRSPAAAEQQLVTSIGVLLGAVESLELNVQVKPRRVPVLGRLLAERFERARPGELNSPPPGLSGFGWGGERLELAMLSLPSHLLEQPLTLWVEGEGRWSLEDHDGQLLVEGVVGERVHGNAVDIEVSALEANPGMRFELLKERPLTTALRYRQHVDVTELGDDSGVLALTLESSEPEQATRILNEIARHYVRGNADRSAAEANASLDFLQNQLPAMRQKLELSEQALNAYQAKAQSIDISLEIQALLNQIVELDSRISELRLQQADIARRFTREHPTYQTIVSQIDSLTARQQRLSHKVETLPETQQELVRLTREVKVNNELYMHLLNRAQELDVTRKSTIGTAQLVDPAVYDPSEPVRPRKAVTVLVAAVVGLVLAVGLILLRKTLYPGIESSKAIEQAGLPVYASVPKSVAPRSAWRWRWRAPPLRDPAAGLLASTDPGDPALEAVRTLRTGLRHLLAAAPNNRLMICGPTPLVGKTFIAANLAAVIARTGQRVLLIDADMRKGYLHDLLHTSAEPGLSDLLGKRCAARAAIRRTAIDGVCLLPRGSLPSNPSELLMHPSFATLLEELGRSFDVVLIDTPPLLAVTDALVVGQLAGVNLLVARFDFTAPRELEQCLQSTAQIGVALHGAVLNAVERRASTRYGYSKSYHHYDYRPGHAEA